MAFSLYVVERLQICISSVSLITDHRLCLLNPPATVDVSDSDREVYRRRRYATDLQVTSKSVVQ